MEEENCFVYLLFSAKGPLKRRLLRRISSLVDIFHFCFQHKPVVFVTYNIKEWLLIKLIKCTIIGRKVLKINTKKWLPLVHS